MRLPSGKREATLSLEQPLESYCLYDQQRLQPVADDFDT